MSELFWILGILAVVYVVSELVIAGLVLSASEQFLNYVPDKGTPLDKQ